MNVGAERLRPRDAWDAPGDAEVSDGALFGLLAELGRCRTVQEAKRQVQRALPVQLGPHSELLWTGSAAPPPTWPLFVPAAAQALAQIQLTERCEEIVRIGLEAAGHSHEPAVAGRLTAQIRRTLGVEGVGLFRLHAGTLRAETRWAVPAVRPPPYTPAHLHVLALGQVHLHHEGLLLPLRNRFPARSFLWFQAPGRVWEAAEIAAFWRVSGVLGAEQERVLMERQLATLLSLQAQVLRHHPQDASLLLLRRAVGLVPGAEAGSLLLLSGGHFRYAAVECLDPGPLRDVLFRPDDLRRQWYGLGEAAWHQGRARILRASDVAAQSNGYLRDGVYVAQSPPFVREIKANLGVPILHENEVYGFLNLDAFVDPDAFGQDSMEAAQAFAMQAALLIHHTKQVGRIHETARTDALTGLLNRRAFSESLMQEVGRAQRDALPLTLLVMDLRRFKLINDAHGHAEGDRALQHVARGLTRYLRVAGESCLASGESARSPAQAFRWGGDEFAVLLPATPLAAAEVGSEGLRRALQTSLPSHWSLDVRLGLAELQAGDLQGERLMREADLSMYSDKARQT